MDFRRKFQRIFPKILKIEIPMGSVILSKAYGKISSDNLRTDCVNLSERFPMSHIPTSSVGRKFQWKNMLFQSEIPSKQ